MAYENKMKPTEVDPRAFIAAVEHPTRRQDAETLLALMYEVSGEEPVMWGPSIVGFGKHHFEYDSGHEGDEPMIGFSPRKSSLVLYVLTHAPESDALLANLGKHRRGKSCLYINKLADVRLDVLRELVSTAYEFMLAIEENDE